MTKRKPNAKKPDSDMILVSGETFNSISLCPVVFTNCLFPLDVGVNLSVVAGIKFGTLYVANTTRAPNIIIRGAATLKEKK